MNTLNYLQSKIQNALNLDFGTIFNEAIELYKKVWVQGLVFYLIIILITIPVVLVFFGPVYVLMFEEMMSGNPDPVAMNAYIQERGMFFMLAYYGVMFLINIVTYLLYAGFFRVIKKADFNQSFTVSEFFYFFKGKYIGKGFVLIFIATIISIIATMLCVLPLFYVIIPLAFMMPVFAFNPDLAIGDIITVGFKLGNKKWGITFGLCVVAYICVLLLSLITCGIGMIFFMSFMFLPIYLVYKAVIGFEDTDVIDEIGISN